MFRLDFFPKFIYSDMTRRTYCGAFLSILMVVCASILCFSEITNFIWPPIKEQLVSVSDLRGSLNELVISYNFTVSVPCVLVHLDVFDMIGTVSNDPSTKSLFKERVDKDGNPIPLTQIADECGECYGAATQEKKCCSTCEDIIANYQAKGWKIENMTTWAQCRAEGIVLNGSERCRVYGSLHVNAIEGGFHIAPGINIFNRFGGHMHDFSPIADQLDLSHDIDYVQFGAPLGPSPLDKTKVVQNGPAQIHYRYNLKAVPTVVTDERGITRGFQYTVNYAEIPVTERGRFGPGIFFVYNFAPVAVARGPDRPNIMLLVARLVSIFGGAFMLARLIDSFGYKLHTLAGKISIGKAE